MWQRVATNLIYYTVWFIYKILPHLNHRQISLIETKCKINVKKIEIIIFSFLNKLKFI